MKIWILRGTYYNSDGIEFIYVGFDKDKQRNAFLIKKAPYLHTLNWLFYEGDKPDGVFLYGYKYLGKIYLKISVKRKWYQFWLPEFSEKMEEV